MEMKTIFFRTMNHVEANKRGTQRVAAVSLDMKCANELCMRTQRTAAKKEKNKIERSQCSVFTKCLVTAVHHVLYVLAYLFLAESSNKL